MKIIVCVKQAASLGDEVGFTADGRAVDPGYLDFALNEWDAYATEEALRLREAQGGEVVAVACRGQRGGSGVRARHLRCTSAATGSESRGPVASDQGSAPG